MLASLCIAGCSSATTPVERVLPGVSQATVSRGSSKNPNLYVANVSTVTVYPPGGGSPLRTLAKLSPSALALDAAGHLYVANIPVSENGNVTVFNVGKSSILRTITKGVAKPRDLAFNAAGDLFVGNSYFRVAEYVPGGSSPIRSFNAFYPSALALDKSANLYIASDPSPYGGHEGSHVFAYNSAGKPLYTITSGLNGPSSLALSSFGTLFVANYVGNNVTVYVLGQTKVLRTISDGVKGPYCILLDRPGNLYVANYLASAITVYASGQSKIARTIKQGISHPTAIAFDSSGNLFVANSKNVTAYAPGADTPFETVTSGVNRPIALGFGP